MHQDKSDESDAINDGPYTGNFPLQAASQANRTPGAIHVILPCNVLALATTYIRDLRNGRDTGCKNYPINHLMCRLR